MNESGGDARAVLACASRDQIDLQSQILGISRLDESRSTDPVGGGGSVGGGGGAEGGDPPVKTAEAFPWGVFGPRSLVSVRVASCVRPPLPSPRPIPRCEIATAEDDGKTERAQAAEGRGAGGLGGGRATLGEPGLRTLGELCSDARRRRRDGTGGGRPASPARVRARPRARARARARARPRPRARARARRRTRVLGARGAARAGARAERGRDREAGARAAVEAGGLVDGAASARLALAQRARRARRAEGEVGGVGVAHACVAVRARQRA